MSNEEIRDTLRAMKARVLKEVVDAGKAAIRDEESGSLRTMEDVDATVGAALDALRKRLESTPNRIDPDAMKRLRGPSSAFYGMSRIVSEETE